MSSENQTGPKVEITVCPEEIAWRSTAQAFGKISTSTDFGEITAISRTQEMWCLAKAEAARKADLSANGTSLGKAMRRGALSTSQRAIIELNQDAVKKLLGMGYKIPTRQERTRYTLPWSEQKVVLYRAKNHRPKGDVATVELDIFEVSAGTSNNVDYKGRKSVVRR